MHYNKELFPFESKWVQIDKEQIHYVDEGEGQVILFSHAAIGSSFMYRRFIQILSQTCRCVALDYPGFGLSSPSHSDEYSIRHQNKIITQFIRLLDLKNIIALGHDTGGPSIFRTAVDYPDWFKGLILTDTIIFPTFEYRKINTMLSIIGSPFIQSLNAWTNFLIKFTINKGVSTRRLRKEEKSVYYSISKTAIERRRITQMLLSLRKETVFMKAVKAGFENQLSSKPALLIYGDKDPVKELGIADRIHAMLRNSELFLIKNEGHFPHEGQPGRMSEIIWQWVQKLKN